MTSTQEIYRPPGCLTLDKLTDIPQIRLGIQGYGGSGKTFASLTFPNPVVMNFDRGLGAHIGRADIIDVPFYNPTFCRSIDRNYTREQLKDVALTWLEKEGMKLSPNQTLIFDNNTTIQNAYHYWYEQNKMSFLTTEGKMDGWAEYKQKNNYFNSLFEVFKVLPCHLVYICHESDSVKKGQKLRPLMSGQVGNELLKHFSDWFRQLCGDKPTNFAEVDANKLRLWGMKSVQEYKEMCDSFEGNSIYLWQTEGDDDFDAKRSSLVSTCPRFVRATYKSFEKFRRKLVQQ